MIKFICSIIMIFGHIINDIKWPFCGSNTISRVSATWFNKNLMQLKTRLNLKIGKEKPQVVENLIKALMPIGTRFIKETDDVFKKHLKEEDVENLWDFIEYKPKYIRSL